MSFARFSPSQVFVSHGPTGADRVRKVLNGCGAAKPIGTLPNSASRARDVRSDRQFRDVMGRFATGVTVVTSRGGDGIPCGLTANAVSSVSLDPPLVLVCITRHSGTLDRIRQSKYFAVSFLTTGQQDVSNRFATLPEAERFDGVEFVEKATGAPVLKGALGWVDCRVHSEFEAGDHSIVVGEVQACDAEEGDPLLYFGGGYRSIAP